MVDRLSKVAARMCGRVRTAGRIEFVRDQGPLRRDLRVQGFQWDPEIHRNLAKTLWAVERSHSYGMAALRLFSKMSSSEFSPDGLLGGRGYIQKVKDMRAGLSQAVEVLSSFADTMHDEVNADHWRSAMQQDPTTEQIVAEAEKANPGPYVEQQFQQEVPSAEDGLEYANPSPGGDGSSDELEFANPSPDDFNPFVSGEDDEEEDETWDWAQDGQSHTSSRVAEEEEDEEGDRTDDLWEGHGDVDGRRRTSSAAGGQEVPEPGPKSGLPTSDPKPQAEGVSVSESFMNTTGEADAGRLARAAARTAAFRRSGDPVKVADSSVDPSALPGPRIMHVGPAESPEELGGYCDDDFAPQDGPGWDGFQGNDPIYEGADANMDGVTGYSDPTDGDVTVFKASAERVASGYSWLPGSRNEKLMPYYDPNVTPEDIQWMRAHDAPDPPAGMQPRVVRPPSDPIWDAVNNAQLTSD